MTSEAKEGVPTQQTDPSAWLQLTLDHLNEWVRSARDAQDVDAIAQIQAALEDVDARRTLLEAWAGPTVSKAKPENEQDH
jgi:hypothetical protein